MSKQFSRKSIIATAALLAVGQMFYDTGSAPAAPAPAAGDTFANMREEFSRLQTEANAVIEKAASENRDLTKDEKAANDTRFSRLKQIHDTIEERLKFAKLALANDPAAPAGGTVQRPSDAPGREEFDKGIANLAFSKLNDSEKDAYRQKFSNALARWAESGNLDRQFATITTATQNSVYLPREVAMPIIPMTSNSLRDGIAAQQMESVSLVKTTTTAGMNVPVVTGTAGGQVAENASSETENTPSLSESITLDVKTYQSGSVYYSNLALAAGTIDVTNNVLPTLVYEKELGLESTIIAAMIADAGITQTVTLAATNAITYAEMGKLNRKLPKRFDVKKIILLSDDAYAAAENLVGSDGHPIFNIDPQNQELKRFNGTPVLRCSYLESLVANKTVGLIISLLGFRLRDITGDQGAKLTRYTQNAAKPDQTGLNLFDYHGYGYAVSAVAKLKTAAS